MSSQHHHYPLVQSVLDCRESRNGVSRLLFLHGSATPLTFIPLAEI